MKKGDKLPVPPISEKTGVSCDYWNEFMYIHLDLLSSFSSDENIKPFEGNPIKKYTQRYSEDKFYDVITPKNQKRVASLDEITDKVNLLISQESFSSTTLVDIICEGHELIYEEPLDIEAAFGVKNKNSLSEILYKTNN